MSTHPRSSCRWFGGAPRERDLRDLLAARRLEDGRAELPVLERPRVEGRDALVGNLDVVRFFLAPKGVPAVSQGRDQRRADPGERVENPVAYVREREHTALDELDRELTGMDGLLGVVGLHVRNVPQRALPVARHDLPHVRRVLAERVPGGLPMLLALEVGLPGVLRGDADGIEIERVGIRL